MNLHITEKSPQLSGIETLPQLYKLSNLPNTLEQQKKLFTVKNTYNCNPDQLYKQSHILNYIEKNNINPKNVLDVGAGHANLSLYLIKNYDINYIGVDIADNAYEKFAQCLKLNNILNKTTRYEQQDFFDFKTDETYDLIYDLCAIIHFDTNQTICKNDGLYKAGLTIKETLTDDGIFIFVSDCMGDPNNLINHRGEYNKEFITPLECLEAFEKAGLKLIKEETLYCSKENINKFARKNILSLHNMDEIRKGWSGFDFWHKK